MYHQNTLWPSLPAKKENNLETPYFLINKDLLDKNIADFKDGMFFSWSNCRVSYSVKTNSLPWLVSYLHMNGIMAEVVSDEEYDLAVKCGVPENEIVFNGPIKTKEMFVKAVNNHAYVNIDSKRELRWLKEENLSSDRLGIRINVPVELFRSEDIGYEEDGFRFGFADATGELKEAIEIIRDLKIEKIGLHLHCNSVTRSPEVYRAVARYAVELVEKFELEITYIDIGGGFFGGVPGKTTPKEYFEVISNELKKSNRLEHALLICEPGSAIIGSVVDLYTSVLDVKDTPYARVVTTDGSRVHIDPLWMKKNYMHTIEAKKSEVFEKNQIICGYTCMDHDRIMKISGVPELSEGDKIIYHRVGAYSMTFGGLFIRYFPDVYVKDHDTYEKVRSRISVQDYFDIERN